MFYKSFNVTVDKYSAMLNQMRQHEPNLENMELDTGKPSAPGAYALADETYAKLLGKLSKSEYKHLTPALKADILRFYRHDRTPRQKKELGDWEEVQDYPIRLEAAQL